MIVAPTVTLERFQGEWDGVYSQQHCFLCKAKLYHTASEHELVLSQGLREEIAR